MDGLHLGTKSHRCWVCVSCRFSTTLVSETNNPQAHELAAGPLSMAFGVTSFAPHGGVVVLFAISPVWGFVVALLAGTVVSALLIVALKKYVGRKELEQAEAAFAAPVAA